ncbi:MAG: hypothetical protein JXR73_06775 [Candidatus Omnitrophica bacterium]|nr:hypothetical protein [Candidatus Omnitrophota bacterium]
MSRKSNDDVKQRRKEAYLLAKGNPWLLWQLQAYRAGYIPPLLPGQIPPELAGVTFGAKDEYDADELAQHAKDVQNRERHYLAKTFILLIISIGLFIGLSVFVQYKIGDHFRIPLLDSIIPRMENQQTTMQ